MIKFNLENQKEIKPVDNIFIISNQRSRIYENYIVRNANLPYQLYLDKNKNYEIENVILKDKNHFLHPMCYYIETQEDQLIVNINEPIYYNFVNLKKYDYGPVIEIDRNKINKINNVNLYNTKINYKTQINNIYFPFEDLFLLYINGNKIFNGYNSINLINGRIYVIQLIDIDFNTYHLVIEMKEDAILQPFGEIYPNFSFKSNKYILQEEMPDLNKIFIGCIFRVPTFLIHSLDFSYLYIKIPKINENPQSEYVLFKNLVLTSSISNSNFLYIPILYPITSVSGDYKVFSWKEYYKNEIFGENFNSIPISFHFYTQDYITSIENNEIKYFSNLNFPLNVSNYLPFYYNLNLFTRHQINQDWDYILYKNNIGDLHISLNRDYKEGEIDLLNGIVFFENDLIDTIFNFMSKRKNFYPLFIVLNQINDDLYDQILQLRDQSIYSLVFVCNPNIKYPNEVDDIWTNDILNIPKTILTFDIQSIISTSYIFSPQKDLVLIKTQIPDDINYIGVKYKGDRVMIYKRIDYGNFPLFKKENTTDNLTYYPLDENSVILLKEKIVSNANTFNLYYKTIYEKTLDDYIKEVKIIEDDYISYYEGKSLLNHIIQYDINESSISNKIDTGFNFISYRINGYLNLIKNQSINNIYNYDGKYLSLFDDSDALVLRKNHIDIFNDLDTYPGVTSSGKNQLLMFFVVYLSYLERKNFSQITRKYNISKDLANNIMQNIKNEIKRISNNLIDLKWKIDIQGVNVIINNTVIFNGIKKEVKEIDITFNFEEGI
jgi:hypothetical protein